jgi:PAS domain S-box-containing protein
VADDVGPVDDNFSTLFNFLPIGAYRSTPQGRQLRANPALARLNGFANEAEQLAAVCDIAGSWYVDPTRREAFMQAMEADGRVVGFESEVTRYKSRERIWISENAHVVRDARGQVLYYEGTVEEITDRVRARDALQRSREEMRQIMALVPGMVYRVELLPGDQRRATYVSPGVRALLGVDPEEVLADSHMMIRMRHPDDQLRIVAESRQAAANQSLLETELRMVLRDGQTKWMQVISAPAPGETGLQARVGIVLDISARKRAEQALREQGELWKRALDHSGDGVWDWHVDTGVETFSQALLALYGYEAGELGTDPDALDQLTHPDDIPAMVQARQDHLDGLTPRYVNEHRVRCKDGSWKWILSRGIVIARNDAGAPLRMIGTHTDITSAKHADELRFERDRAAAADLAKSQFLSRVSHELRTPLNAILGFSQLLELDATVGPRQREWVQQVLHSGRHLLGLMDDILDLSSAQTGQLSMNIEAQPLRLVIEEVRAMFDLPARQAGVALVDDVPAEGLPCVRADRKRLKQVLSNLLSNAIKYNRPGGWVRIAARRDGDQVAIDVADSGPGLSAEQQARLFQPFERLGAQRGAVAGTGLGLALARQLAEAMNGSLAVRSAPGAGATFELRLMPG